MKHYYTKLLSITLFLLGVTSISVAQNQYYLNFDGSNDYVYRIDNSVLDRMNNASEYTIEAWIYISSWTDYQRIANRYSHWDFYLRKTGQLAFRVDVSGTWKLNYSANNAVTTGSWQHVAIIRSGGKIHFYVNGVNKDAGTYNGYTLPGASTNDHLYIGQFGSSTAGAKGTNLFNGYIDEFRCKNVAINSANLHSNINDNEYNPDANTGALYHFNEGSGTSTKEETQGYNATLYGTPSWTVWNAIVSHLPLANEWLGGSSTDWNTAGNWGSGSVPASTNDVIVPNVTNQPTIASGNVGDCGNLKIDPSATLTVSGTLNVGGDFTNDGVFVASGSIKYNGSNEQTIAAGTYNDLDIDNSSAANCTLAGDVVVGGTLNIAGDITIPNGNTLDCNGDITTTGDCVIHNNGTMAVGGSFTQNGAYTETAGLVQFDGSAAQTIPADNYYDIEINNSNGVALGGNVSINDVLTLTSGVLTSTSTNLLTFTSTAGAVSGGSNTAYVDGPMAKVGSGAFIFPAGDGGKWARIGISNLSASETFTAEYTKAKPANNTTMASSLSKVSDNEGWTLERSGSASADVTLYWEDSKWSGVGDFTDLRIAHWNGSSWEAESGTYSHSGNVSLTTSESGSITVTGVSSFSPFSLGSTDNTTNTLPVELIYFDLSKKDNSVNLFWQTATEFNNNGFEIQRSSDTKDWETIGFVKGAGNSNIIQNYSFNDNSPRVFNYYRLKQIDFDGAFKFSDIKFLKLGETLTINSYPNPVVDILNINISNIKQIDIYNIAGKLVKRLKSNTNIINVSELKTGVYFFVVTKNDGSQTRAQFMKK